MYNLFNIINFWFSNLHVCNFKTPILSKYVTFNSRSIIYECDCGKKEIKSVYKNFGEEFPIETTPLITDKDMYKISNNSKKLGKLDFEKIIYLLATNE